MRVVKRTAALLLVLTVISGALCLNIIPASADSSGTPIVYVPGIMGSRLFRDSNSYSADNSVWDPKITRLSYLRQLDFNSGASLAVRPCENQNIDPGIPDEDNSVTVYGREYGARDTSRKIIDALCDSFPYTDPDTYRPVYFFSYDWRRSNSDSAEGLEQAIDDIIGETGASRVDIVCHSMGGLVASKLYTNTESRSKIGKIITLGTPYEGSPKLIDSILTNKIVDSSFFNYMLEINGLTTGVKSSFAGVTELIPTAEYVSEIPMTDSAGESLSYSGYAEYCSSVFGEEAYSDARQFQASLKSDGANALYGCENAFFAIGINQVTIGSISLALSEDESKSVRLYESDISYETKGDGAVPYASAAIADRIRRLPPQRWRLFESSHIGLQQNADCLGWVTDILNGAQPSAENAAFTNGRHIKLRISGDVNVTVSKGREKLASSGLLASYSASFGRMDIVGENSEVKVCCLDSAYDYTVTLSGNAVGSFNYEISYLDGSDEIEGTRRFTNVPVTQRTSITNNPGRSAAATLNISENGVKSTLSADPPGVSVGDTDGNGRVDINDATALQKHLAKLLPLKGDRLNAADANGDFSIDINDVTMIQKYVAELIDEF